MFGRGRFLKEGSFRLEVRRTTNLVLGEFEGKRNGRWVDILTLRINHKKGATLNRPQTGVESMTVLGLGSIEVKRRLNNVIEGLT